MSRDRGQFVRHDREMGDSNEELLFNEALCARVQSLRKTKGEDWTQERMASILGIPPDRYRKYENRSPMPLYLIPRFAAVVDRSIEYVVTGKDIAIISRQAQRRRA